MRIVIAAFAGLFALRPFLHNGILGGDDARWYTTVIADQVEQWRAGLWPSFVGQTRFAPIGTVIPIRVAPLLQHLAIAIDWVTLHKLRPYLLLNLAVSLSGAASCLSAYLCLKAILPKRRTAALLLAILYAWCPGTVGLSYTGQLFMSAMALPFLPLVFTGVYFIFERNSFLGWAMAAVGCAGCFLAHSPIGLWASVAATVVVVARWFSLRGLTKRDLGRAAAATGLFLILCGYVFISVSSLASPNSSHAQLDVLLQNVRNTVPAVFLPITKFASEVTDLQLGWSLMAIALMGVATSLVSFRAPLVSLSLSSVVLLLLALPVPFIDRFLWAAVPTAVLDATNAAPTQRLYAIIAACTVTLAAACIGAFPGRRRWIEAFLLVAVAWSGLQLRPFLLRGKMISNTTAVSDESLLPENLPLARFSLGMLSFDDRFFSNGVMDFSLEQRVLSVDQRTYILSDVAAVAPGHDFGEKTVTHRLPGNLVGSSPSGERVWVDLDHKLTLEPGKKYLLALDITNPDWTGTLQIKGAGFLREYALPSSGLKYAFGFAEDNSRVIPLATSSKEPVELTLNFINPNQDTDLAIYHDFARFELIPYEPASLPIRLVSMAPYLTRVNSPAQGWLETFRCYIPGWAAVVNGKKVEVTRSGNGLVAVPVSKGENEVRLSYTPPLAVTFSYWVTWCAWLALAAITTWRYRFRYLS